MLPRAMGVTVLLVSVLGMGACSDADAARRTAAHAAIADLLEQDEHSAALAGCMKTLADLGDDPRLQLLAAQACNGLQRRAEAIGHADQGLLLLDEGDPALRGELQWAKGVGLVARFRDLGAEGDWRAANTSLEYATAAGGRRFDAAVLLAVIQDLGDHKNDERQLRFARLALELRPEAPDVAKLVALLESKGLAP